MPSHCVNMMQFARTFYFYRGAHLVRHKLNVMVILAKLSRAYPKFLKENGQVVSKHRGDVRSLILEDEHIQWLVEMLDVDPNIIFESLYCQINEVFQFPCHVFINCI